MEEEALELELVSPRISFSHDLASFAAAAPPTPSRRSDASRDSSSRLRDDPDFDFANASAAAADVAPADRLFAGGKLLPVPPLPPAPRPGPCKQQQSSCGAHVNKAQAACQQRRPAGSWASPLFSRSSSVNSATTAAGAPRSAGRFGCPTFPLMRSWSAGSAAVARDDGLVTGGAAVSDAAGHRRPHHHQCYKKFGGGAAAATNNGPGGSSRSAYYYGGGSRKGSSSRHGVRVSPVLNVPFIGTSVANVLSYLLCDCSHKTKKSREF
ncbi:hypothetical protein U9M48_020625 [Paspalum notatum var. saurae]|uniref:Uncharacterized protein n=1 Tax=Paspalum notatum var. saurae TaxID=547442 RepID=A0AAQ3THU3_PASNO